MVSAKVTAGRWRGIGSSSWEPSTASAPSSSEGKEGSSAEWCARGGVVVIDDG
jgi:hypothetical protein